MNLRLLWASKSPKLERKIKQDSPMRLHGSSASSASVASRLYGTRSRRDSLGSDPELISFSDSDMHDITNQVSVINTSCADDNNSPRATLQECCGGRKPPRNSSPTADDDDSGRATRLHGVLVEAVVGSPPSTCTVYYVQ
ncbi:hypothetical protein Y032_0064g3481 [Ancylostoma ceylanicum]|uniref:Uncharacterized protein n=1 Tax=Ancylostoma ceylanicum TaxID=53326 RepID=A0A016U264_9BILA|nr:hypothetical protein Y032_0064g3481 [Ancylostoma ceylanicum]